MHFISAIFCGKVVEVCIPFGCFDCGFVNGTLVHVKKSYALSDDGLCLPYVIEPANGCGEDSLLV